MGLTMMTPSSGRGVRPRVVKLEDPYVDDYSEMYPSLGLGSLEYLMNMNYCALGICILESSALTAAPGFTTTLAMFASIATTNITFVCDVRYFSSLQFQYFREIFI
jgi:hypothetical protein